MARRQGVRRNSALRKDFREQIIERSRRPDCNKVGCTGVTNNKGCKMIRFECPKCGKSLRASNESSGLKAKCSGCGSRVVVPAASAAAPPVPAETAAPRNAPPREESEPYKLSEPEEEFVPAPDLDEALTFEETELPPPLPPSPRPALSHSSSTHATQYAAQQIDRSYRSLRIYIRLVRSFARIAYFVFVALVVLVCIGGTYQAFRPLGGGALSVVQIWLVGLFGVVAGLLVMVSLVAMVEWMEATADTGFYVKELFLLTQSQRPR